LRKPPGGAAAKKVNSLFIDLSGPRSPDGTGFSLSQHLIQILRANVLVLRHAPGGGQRKVRVTNMKNVPIILKFLSVMGIFGVFAIAVAVYSTSQMRGISNGYSALMAGDAAAALDASRAGRAFQTMRSAEAIVQIVYDDADLKAAQAELNSARGKFTEYMDKAAAAAPAHAAALNQIEASGLDVINNQCAAAWQAGYSSTTQLGNMAAQKIFVRDCNPKFSPITTALSEQIIGLGNESAVADAALTGMTDRTIMITYGAIIGGLIFVMGIGFFAIRAWVVRPVAGLQKVMGRLAAGELGAEVRGIERRDEIGGMARALQVFKEAGLEKQRVETEAARAREAAEAERRANEAERAAAAAQQQQVVTSLAAGLERLSAGDLLFRIGSAFSAEYEKLRHDFNGAVEKLQAAMRGIAANTHGVKAGAAEITAASDDLSRRTEQQAASLEQTAAALDEITATVRKSAESAAEARSLVSEAKTDAESAGTVVRDTVNAMSGIESSSKQIGNIIVVIDEIAFQTNLLALNAGVEAARAGDAGRGFAVVATEVRALAQRSADAAKEIKGLISDSGQQVESGVKLVGRTGHALERIVAQVARLNALVSDIAASAREQATALGEVNSAVNKMDQVTQQNAAMVEQSTAASHTLEGEAAALSRLVGTFQIGAVEAAHQAPRPAARGPGMPQPVRRPPAGSPAAPAPPGGFKPVPRAVAAAASGGEDWDEF
jgi:methyl-accepting chemotaxis protein